MQNTKLSPPHVAVVLAQLMERLEASRAPDAHQYRTVAARLADALQDSSVDWAPLLNASAAAADVYENLHYDHAGLCRAPLEKATRAELAAREAIARARRHPSAGPHQAGAPQEHGV